MGRGSSGSGGNNRGNVSKLPLMVREDPANILSALPKLMSQGNLSKANFTANGSSVKQQAVTFESGNNKVDVYFHSYYEPKQVTNPKSPIKTGIYATLWENGNAVSFRTITESKTKSLKNAKKQYEDILNEWKKATKQKQIKF